MHCKDASEKYKTKVNFYHDFDELYRSLVIHILHISTHCIETHRYALMNHRIEIVSSTKNILMTEYSRSVEYFQNGNRKFATM